MQYQAILEQNFFFEVSKVVVEKSKVDVMYSLDNLEAATLSLFGMGVYTT
jgi:hypothetical protein